MVRLILVIFNLIYRISSLKANDIYKQTQGCLDDTKTYIINIHAHIQNEVKDAIVSLAYKLPNSLLLDEIQGIGGENASIIATRSYLGTIIEEMNFDLDKFNIQLNLVFENLEIDQLSANGAYDPSCEIASPVRERTAESFGSFMLKHNNKIGVHLIIFGCVFKNPEFDLIHVMANGICGRAIGVMWDGSVNTKTLIKSAIIEAITGSKDTYAKGFFSIVDKNILCGYFEKCVGLQPSIHGKLVDSKTFIRYTVDFTDNSLPVVKEL